MICTVCDVWYDPQSGCDHRVLLAPLTHEEFKELLNTTERLPCGCLYAASIKQVLYTVLLCHIHNIPIRLIIKDEQSL